MFWQKCSLKVDYDVGESYFYFSTLSQDFALGAWGAVITTLQISLRRLAKMPRLKTYLDQLLIASVIANLHSVRVTVQTSFLFLGFGNRHNRKHCL